MNPDPPTVRASPGWTPEPGETAKEGVVPLPLEWCLTVVLVVEVDDVDVDDVDDVDVDDVEDVELEDVLEDVLEDELLLDDEVEPEPAGPPKI